MRKVIIHTDGACKGNPGPGAYGAVLVCGKHRKEISAGYRLTTNNRMELRAAIKALELLAEPCEVELEPMPAPQPWSEPLLDGVAGCWVSKDELVLGPALIARAWNLLAEGGRAAEWGPTAIKPSAIHCAVASVPIVQASGRNASTQKRPME